MRRAAAILGCLSGLVLMAGCNTYKYFEVQVTFNPANLDSTQTGLISACMVTVSGADSNKFRIPNGICPKHNAAAPLDVGVFEYSTFADSGSLTFKLEAFTGMGMMQNCKLAEGTVTVPVTGETTIKAAMVVSKVGEPCTMVTPPTSDAGI